MNGYFDYNATAPVRPQVHEAMIAALSEIPGNPSSMHAGGRRARSAIDQARSQVAELAGVTPSEIIFTSGATEANNLALRGAMAVDRKRHLIVSRMEHASVSATADALEQCGHSVLRLDVSPEGIPLLGRVADILEKTDSVLSISCACGETGHTVDTDELLAVLPERHLLHVDATQAVGRLDRAVPERADLVSFSGHKLGGPAGTGVLVVRERAKRRIAGILSGGRQENGLRAGTENTAGIVGLGVAAAVVTQQARAETRRLRVLRDRIQSALRTRIDELTVITPANGLPNTLMVSARFVAAETLVAGLDLEGYAISTGSACAAASPEPSAVLEALGLEEQIRNGAVRISLGWATHDQEIDGFVDAFVAVATRVRAASCGAAA
ncbi:MAG: cysteine desulfurase [Hyphomicrobiaceae bacterium]